MLPKALSRAFSFLLFSLPSHHFIQSQTTKQQCTWGS